MQQSPSRDESAQPEAAETVPLPSQQPDPPPPQPVSECGIWHSSSLGSVLISRPSASTWNGETVVGESPTHAAEGARAELDGSPTIATLTDVSVPPTLLMAKSRYFSPGHWLHSVILP
ncbi:hypothetical protein CGCF413_v000965 [Colletotrichum fructicola]|nr:hypothetical protein CGCF413_v000965 [Colletotrichum fructicola]